MISSSRLLSLSLALAFALLLSHHAAAFTLSNTLGDHMVLQRDTPAVVWGFAAATTEIKTTFGGTTYSTATGSDGVWRQTLPATGAGGPYTIAFSGSDGGSAALADVLFGGAVGREEERKRGRRMGRSK